jgi:hypothetical protein
LIFVKHTRSASTAGSLLMASWVATGILDQKPRSISLTLILSGSRLSITSCSTSMTFAFRVADSPATAPAEAATMDAARPPPPPCSFHAPHAAEPPLAFDSPSLASTECPTSWRTTSSKMFWPTSGSPTAVNPAPG